MRSGLTVLSTVALGGGLALALAAPAQAAVPASSCGEGTTFAVSSGPSVDASLVSSVTDALAKRGFSAAPASAADLSATIAPASELAESGSASVMGVAISTADLDPATATEGKDWVAVTGAAGDAAEQLLADACGPLPTPEPTPADEADPEQGVDEPAPTAPAAPAQSAGDATSASTQEQAAPATESAVPAAKSAAPAVGSTSEEQSTASASEESAAAAPAAPAPAAAASPAASAKGGASSSAASASVADKDCGDFGSQDEAQTFFEDNGGPSSDEHRLDADDDGQACETHFGGDDATAAAAASTSGDKDCADFGSQAEAQAFFTGQGGPASDEHRLDRDTDGQACEDHFGGDNASRAEARTINAGMPAAGDVSPVGLAGGVLLAGAGLALGLRARRS